MNALDALVGTFLDAAADGAHWAVGTVQTVTAGAAADGNPLVSVRWQGSNVLAAYLSSYTPVVGHVVVMARVGAGLLIIGRAIGTPPSS